MRLSQVSRDLSVAASDDSLWREVLQHQFDVVRPHGSQKELVKKLHQGITEGWEGLCLDRHTAHWTPHPVIIEVGSASAVARAAAFVCARLERTTDVS